MSYHFLVLQGRIVIQAVYPRIKMYRNCWKTNKRRKITNCRNEKSASFAEKQKINSPSSSAPRQELLTPRKCYQFNYNPIPYFLWVIFVKTFVKYFLSFDSRNDDSAYLGVWDLYYEHNTHKNDGVIYL